MRFERRKLLYFAAVFVPSFPLFVYLYTLVLPQYEYAVLVLANPVLERSTPPVHIDVGAEGDLLAYTRDERGTRRPLFSREYHAHVVFMSLILLPPLLLATPVGLLRRLRLLGAGLLLMYGVHVLSIIGLLRSSLCLQRDPEQLVCQWLRGLTLTSGQIGAVVIWALLTWTVWFPRPTET